MQNLEPKRSIDFMTKRNLHSIRVAVDNWLHEDQLEHLLRLLGEYPCGITQMALFTTTTHIPMTLQTFAERLAIIEKRLEMIREAGFSAGINHLTTIGHHCEDLGAGLKDQYTYMTNIKGEVCQGSYCMRNEKLLKEYIVPCYTMMANTHPDFIWIDDDIRYGHMPIGNGCFCDGCIKAFNEKHGFTYTRETLHAALNENNTALRKLWLDHNSDAICELFAVIADTVYAIDPHITLGFMTGERYFEGYQFARYAQALSAGGTHEIMWRPGGGAYDDFSYDSIVSKKEELGRQNAYLPEYVTVVQSEIENFPYQLLKKTPKSTAMEAAMSMTVGCSGAAFNILPSETKESLDTIIPHLRAINSLAAFYRKEQELLFDLVPTGIHTGWRIDSQAAVPEGEFSSMYGGMYAAYAREMFLFGLPQAFHKEHAPVTLLTGQAAAVMNDDEILKVLSGGVYMDALALRYLWSRGFGDLLGFGAGEEIPVDAREQYIGHPFNEKIVGGIRNCRQAFNIGNSTALIPQSPKCQVLSRLIDYHERVLCDCACGVFENALGGRICIAGYYPFEWVSDYQKTIQLNRLFVWLSKGTLPSFTDNYKRVHNITLCGDGRLCVTQFNAGNDDLYEVSVAVRTKKNTAVLYTMYEGEKTLQADHTVSYEGNEYQYFTIPQIKPFEGVILSI